MSYTAPLGNAVNFSWVGAPSYTAPAGNALAFSWVEAGVTGTGSATLDFAVAASGAHGVAGVGAATLGFTAAAAGEHESITVEGVGAATLGITAAAEGAHGVAGAAAATLGASAAGQGAHGVAGTGASTLSFSAAAVGAHGVAGSGAATFTMAAAGVAVHERYEVRGEVRDGGILVNRRVRVYLRSSGALVGEVDTVVGAFHVHTGFVEAEHYLVPINLDDAATDWTPPVANRVVSVLAQDA